jgi:uncharacterized protein YecE (DUF72 family)
MLIVAINNVAMTSDQFDLFGEPIEPSLRKQTKPRLIEAAISQKEARVKPASSEVESLRALAERLPQRVHIGTSSWSYPGWAGIVYDDAHSEQTLARYGLPAYAQHPLLRTVGIDRTFYAPIAESEFRGYAKQVEAINPAFRFLVKAPMRFTGSRLRSDDGVWADNHAFLDASLATAQFVLPATQGLGIHCGPLVFQFPPLGPRFTRAPAKFADRLAEFLIALPKLSGDAVYAVEIRDPELLTEDYLAALCAGGATHCIAIHARMPSAIAQSCFWRESGRRMPLVIRWSLHSGLNYEEAKERYRPFNALVDEDPQGREHVAKLIADSEQTDAASFVIVNNKAEGSSPLSIRKLVEHLVEQRADK